MRTSEVQHEANGSSGSIQTLPIGLKALFITLWKYTLFCPLVLFHIKTFFKMNCIITYFKRCSYHLALTFKG